MRWLLFIIFGIMGVSPALACSVDDSYRLPTNFELVQRAKIIVLARITTIPPGPHTAEFDSNKALVRLEPVRFLKGSAPSDELMLFGWQAPENWSGLPTPTTLSQSHFSAGLGACIRQFYAPGELVVAMFEADPEMQEFTGRELSQIGDPWARAVETVDNPNDIWVQAVERYLDLQASSADMLKEQLDATVAHLTGIATPAAQAIAADLKYHSTRDRTENVWGSFSTPQSTAAGIPGAKGLGLQCMAGTAPTLMLDGKDQVSVELIVDGVAFTAQVAEPTPAEKMAMDSSLAKLVSNDPPRSVSLHRFAAPDALFQALQTTASDVQVRVNGQALASAKPLDALYRWAGHCEKLQQLPAPSVEE